MWDWISCNLLGRHQEVVTADRASLHLRCLRCGHRTNGWQLEKRFAVFETARSAHRPMVQAIGRQPS